VHDRVELLMEAGVTADRTAALDLATNPANWPAPEDDDHGSF
jgi:hypothetical protein